ncbi:hypothetical protein CDL15_Pgr021763 [Punica granatum]|uniref:Uncharacterized protein n=1 Tax=Punica granatum TaxID=22663 RepID=A0A218WSZ3_PUNGR|nr:hypothetical protein CDL15_Pgr021763 [Punica granatum]
MLPALPPIELEPILEVRKLGVHVELELRIEARRRYCTPWKLGEVEKEVEAQRS